MLESRVVRKVPAALLGFLLCLGALLVSGLFSARAFAPQEGKIGGCTWEYVDNGNGDVVFRLYPTNGVEGTASWDGDHPDYDNTEKYRDYYTKVTRVIIDKPVKLTKSAAGMFWSFEKVRAMDLSGLRTDGVTDFRQMFRNCQSLTYLNLSGLKINNAANAVVNMKEMFLDCKSLKEVDVSGWDMSKVTSLESAFQNCEALEKVKGMETWTWNGDPKLQNMQFMFQGCKALKEVNVSALKTDNVTTVYKMFYGCVALPSLDVGKWNVGKLENARDIFLDCHALEEIKGIEAWVPQNLTTIVGAFSGCHKLKKLSLNNWKVSGCTSLYDTFANCRSLEHLEVNKWEVDAVTGFESAFRGCSSLTELDLSNWKIKVGEKAANLTSTFTMPYENSPKAWDSLRYLDISGAGWDSTHVPEDKIKHFIGSASLCVLKISNYMNLDKNKEGKAFVLDFAGSSEYTGSKSGTEWQHVDETNGGTIDKPVGTTFKTVQELAKFNDKSGHANGYRAETYVRVSSSQYFIFDKNSPDAEGHMEPQIIKPNEKGNINASTFTYPGHRMLKWNTKKDGTGEDYAVGKEYTNPGSDNKRPIVLYAQWGTNEYKLAFNSNAPDGTSPEGTMAPKNVAYGEKLPKNNFSITGHDFAGWALNKEGTGTIYADEQEVPNLSSDENGKVTLYAQWFKHGQEYKIEFEANKPADAGSVSGVMTEQKVTYSKDARLKRNKFTCDGYGFVGWGREANAAEKDSIADGALIKDVLTRPKPTTIKLYAQWNKQRAACNIVFDANAPENVTPTGSMRHMMLWQGEEKELPANGFSCPNYKFLCWSTDKEGLKGNCYQDKQKISTVATSPSQPEITLYAQWIRPNQSYNVVFDPNYASDARNPKGQMGEQSMTYDKEDKLSKNGYACDNYVFMGWSRNSDYLEGDEFFSDGATVKGLVVRPPQDKVTLYAVWIKNNHPYDVVFDPNFPSGATNQQGQMTPQPMTYGTAANLSENKYTCDSHTFMGWSRNKVVTEDDFFKDKQEVQDLIVKPPFGKVTLYAQWIKNNHPYDVVFDSNYPSGATNTRGEMTPQPMKYGTAANLSENKYTCDGHTFMGWSRNKTVIEEDGVTKDAVTKDAVTEDGFFKDKQKVQDLVVKPPFDKVTLYAIWVKNGTTYNVIFDPNCPSDSRKGEMAPQPMEYGKAAELSENKYTWTGHTFMGWSRNKTVIEEDGVTKDAVTKDAVTEDGFFKDKQKVQDLVVKPPFDKVTLYAIWVKNGTTYNVIFDPNCPSDSRKGEMAPQPMEYGKAAELSENKYTWTGHTFMGWSRNKTVIEEDGVTKDAVTKDAVTEDGFFKDKQKVQDLVVKPPFDKVTLYAIWVKNGTTYNVIFDPNCPSDSRKGEMAPQPMEYGKAAELSENKYTWTGHTFMGWSRNKTVIEEDGVTKDAVTKDAVTEDGFFKDKQKVQDLVVKPPFDKVTLYAVWVKNGTTCNVIFDPNCPSDSRKGEMAPQPMEYGKAAELSENKYTWTGHTFMGWSRNKTVIEEDGVTKDAVTKDAVTEDGFFKDKQKVQDLVVKPPFDKVTLYAVWVKNGTTYNVIFDPNCPSDSRKGEMAPQPMEYGKAAELSENKYTWTGHTFMGWSRNKTVIEEDGVTKDAVTKDAVTEDGFFKDKQKVQDLVVKPPFDKVTLYAVWVKNGTTYNVIFDPNCPSDSRKGEMAPQPMEYGKAAELSENKYTWTGHTFMGWSRNKTVIEEDGVTKDAVTKDAVTEDGFFKDKQKVQDLVVKPPFDKVTLYAVWVKNGTTYNVIFDPNCPSDSRKGEMAPQPMEYGKAAELSENKYTWTGHTFMGWSRNKTVIEEDGVTKDAVTKDAVTEDGFFKDKQKVQDLVVKPPFDKVTLYAVWVKNGTSYNVIFDPNFPSQATHTKGGGETRKQRMEYNKDAKLSKNIYECSTPAGACTFVGWSRNKTVIEEDGVTKDAVTGGAVTKDDFFKDEASVKNLIVQPPFDKVTLYAVWVEKGTSYKITFDPNCPPDSRKGEMAPQPMEYGTAAELSENKYTRVGHTFVGWSRNKTVTKDTVTKDDFFKNGQKVQDLVVEPPFDEVTLYAVWVEIGAPYRIIFDPNCLPDSRKGEMAPQPMKYGTAAELSENKYTRVGHTFVGWSRNKTVTKDTVTKDDFFKNGQEVQDLVVEPPLDEVTLYAVWVEKGTSYEITFDPNFPSGATNQQGQMDFQPMKYGTAENLFQNTYTCDGHTFMGWSRNKTVTKDDFFKDGQEVQDLVVEPPLDKVTLYAQWLEDGAPYDVIFDPNYPSDAANPKGQMGNQRMEYGKEDKLFKNDYTCTNYVFMGWSSKLKATEEDDFFKDEASVKNLVVEPSFDKVTLYAQWIENDHPYDVVFDANYPSEADDPGTSGSHGPKMDNQRMEYGKEKKLDKGKYTFSGYTFLGWSRSSEATEDDFFEDEAIVKNLIDRPSFDKVILYARWIKDGTPYNINFDANYPSDATNTRGEMDPQPMEYGKEQKLFKNKYACSRYTFVGWSRIQEGSQKDFFEDEASVKNVIVRPPLDKVTLYAQWAIGTRITYTAKKGGSVSRAYEVIKDDAEPKGSTAAPDDDYHFVKWTVDIKPDWSCTKPDLGKEEVEAVAQEDDGTFFCASFKAHFRSNFLLPEDIYTVTFDKNAFNVQGKMDVETFLRDEVETLPSCTFTKDGYEFSGWNTKADGSGTPFVDEAEINFSTTTPITLYAQWKRTGQVSTVSSSSKGDYSDTALPRGEDGNRNWQRHDDKVFYYKDGAKLTGWQKLGGTVQDPSSGQQNWFYFNGDGTMLTGRHKLVGGLPNAQGVQEEHWFSLDEKTGAQIRHWQKVGDGTNEKWYYYRPEDGAGLVGKHEIIGGFKNAQGAHELNGFFFDTNTGAQVRGWHRTVEDGAERWYYYRDGDGIMLKGQHELVGGFDQCKNWFYFDEVTGIQIRGWKYIDYQDKWCYYRGSDGIMLKGQHELEGGDNGGMNWFYFDEATGAEFRNCWKEIPSQDKTCYYGSDGAMYKGWHSVDDEDYYFNEDTGAVS